MTTTHNSTTASRNAALSAPAAYQGARDRVAALIAELTETLETHRVDAPHWGHVGDLSYVESKLADVVSFLTGEEL